MESTKQREFSFRVTGTGKVYKIVAKDFNKAQQELLNLNNEIVLRDNFLFEKDRRIVIFNVKDL